MAFDHEVLIHCNPSPFVIALEVLATGWPTLSGDWSVTLWSLPLGPRAHPYELWGTGL